MPEKLLLVDLENKRKLDLSPIGREFLDLTSFHGHIWTLGFRLRFGRNLHGLSTLQGYPQGSSGRDAFWCLSCLIPRMEIVKLKPKF
jgi:hypothetical protein